MNHAGIASGKGLKPFLEKMPRLPMGNSRVITKAQSLGQRWGNPFFRSHIASKLPFCTVIRASLPVK